MSLINQMLKDIEQRKTASKGGDPIGGLEAPVQERKGARWTLLAGLTIGVALVCGAAGFFWGKTLPVAGQKEVGPGGAPVIPDVPEHMQKRRDVPAPKPSTVTEPAVAVAKAEPPTALEEEKPAPDLLAVGGSSEPKKASPSATAGQGVARSVAGAPESPEGKSSTEAPRAVPSRPAEPPRPVPEEQPVLSKAVAEPSPAQQVEKARRAFAVGKNSQARILAEKALKRDPGFDSARTLLVSISVAQGKMGRAETLLEEGMVHSSSPESFRIRLARMQLTQGRLKDAETTLQGMDAPSPASFPDWYALSGRIHQQQGRYADAANQYRVLLTEKPQARWWLGLALAEEGQGRLAQAAQAYRALVNHPSASQRMKTFAEQRITALGGRTVQ